MGSERCLFLLCRGLRCRALRFSWRVFCRRRWLFACGGNKAHAFLVVLSHDVKAQEVGRPRLGTRAGNDCDDFARPHIAALLQQPFRAIDHGLCSADLGTADGRGSPQHAHAIDSDFAGTEGEDWGAGMVLRKLARGCAGLGEYGNAAQVEIVSRVRGRFADGLAD